MHPHHGAQWRTSRHWPGSSRCSRRGSQRTCNRTSPGRHSYSHDGACCSRVVHQPLYDLENSISPKATVCSVEATVDFAPALVGRESANHPRFCHSDSGPGRIPLPSLHLPLGRIKKIQVNELSTSRWLNLAVSRSYLLRVVVPDVQSIRGIAPVQLPRFNVVVPFERAGIEIKTAATGYSQTHREYRCI